MSFLPNEIFSDITNFLPNDDITDLMLLSRKFNALVVPRLQKINQEMRTMNQFIKSFMPSPSPEPSDNEWISQLNLKKFEPIGFAAKKRMKDVFKNDVEFIRNLRNAATDNDVLDGLKEKMSLDRFDGSTFLRILSALVSVPKFRQEYNVLRMDGELTTLIIAYIIVNIWGNFEPNEDLRRIWKFYNPSSNFNPNEY